MTKRPGLLVSFCFLCFQTILDDLNECVVVYSSYQYTARPTQPSIPPGSVNEYQLLLGRQGQVWFIPIADERGVCR